MKYDLRYEPWINVEFLDGSKVKVGLQQLFEQAHEIRSFHHDNPLAEAALMRILIALSHRILNGPKDKKSWKEAFEAGRYDADAVEAYFDRWKDRFDLFHEKYPFMQVVELQTKKIKLQRLVHHIATGENATLFDHSTDDMPKNFIAEEAIYILLIGLVFRPRGRKDSLDSNICGNVKDVKTQYSCSDGNMVGKYTVFLNSNSNLFKTLMLNTFHESFINSFFNLQNKLEDDTTPWEEPKYFCKKEKNAVKGYLDYLTFSSRLIRLEIDERYKRVFYAHICCGPALPEYILYEPFVPYRIKQDGSIDKLAPKEERLLWRDSHTLFSIDSQNNFTLKALSHLQNISRFIWKNLSIVGFSIITENDKTKEYIKESIPIPQKLIKNPTHFNNIKQAISQSEKMDKKLNNALKEFSDLTEISMSHIKGVSMKNYWLTLDLPFKSFLNEIDSENALKRWENQVQKAAVEAFDKATKPLLGQKARLLEAYVKARQKLYQSKGGKS